MELIIPVLLNCLMVLGIYAAEKYTEFKNIKYMKKQIIIGVLFGGISAFASSYGVKWLGAIVNVRDAAPLSAGLIFGAPAGIISGFIGGLYRWFSVYWGGGEYTQLACSVATILAGFMAAGLRKLMFDNKKPTWVYGICIAITCEVIHMILIFITNMDNSSYAFEFVKGATIPMILGNAAAVGFAILIVTFLSDEKLVRKKKNERIAKTFQRWLLSCIIIAFLVTSSFTFILQNGIVNIETQEVFTSAMSDVESDIKGKSDKIGTFLTVCCSSSSIKPARTNVSPSLILTLFNCKSLLWSNVASVKPSGPRILSLIVANSGVMSKDTYPSGEINAIISINKPLSSPISYVLWEPVL